jgi:hypothetical protein
MVMETKETNNMKTKQAHREWVLVGHDGVRSIFCDGECIAQNISAHYAAIIVREHNAAPDLLEAAKKVIQEHEIV